MIGMAAFPAFQLPPQDPDGRRFGISVLEQLEQFRKRLIRSAIAILVGMLVAFTFIDRIVTFVLSPARAMLPRRQPADLHGADRSLLALHRHRAPRRRVVLASPFVLYQFWLLIAPALYSHQKKFAIPFVALTIGRRRRSARPSATTSSSRT